MRRIVLGVLVLLLAVVMVRFVTTKRPSQPTEAHASHYVLCQSAIIFTLSDRRFIAYVEHPFWGASDEDRRNAINATIERLPVDEIPEPWPVPDLLDRYKLPARTVCLQNWQQAFDFVDLLTFGGATRNLGNFGSVITERELRRAVLSMFYADDMEVAEAMFPLQHEK